MGDRVLKVVRDGGVLVEGGVLQGLLCECGVEGGRVLGGSGSGGDGVIGVLGGKGIEGEGARERMEGVLDWCTAGGDWALATLAFAFLS
jgi:hypothetical protein